MQHSWKKEFESWNNRKIRMKRNIVLNTAGNLIYNLCQWLLTILVVRLLSNYENAGYLGMAMTTGSTYFAITLWA
jgi:hypothetical protein